MWTASEEEAGRYAQKLADAARLRRVQEKRVDLHDLYSDHERLELIAFAKERQRVEEEAWSDSELVTMYESGRLPVAEYYRLAKQRGILAMTVEEATELLDDPQKRHSGPFVKPEIKEARRVVAREVVRRRELTERK